MLKPFSTIYNIPFGVPFGDCLAKGIMEQYGDNPELFAQIKVFLPSHKDAHALKESFLRLNYGKILFLPKILLLDDNILPYATSDLKRPISNHVRKLVLARLVLEIQEMTYSKALSFASTLIELVDSLQSEYVDFNKLNDVDVDCHHENWQKNLSIASKIIQSWSEYILKYEYIDPIIYRNKIFETLTNFWQENPPNNPIIIAGITNYTTALANFVKLVGQLPNGSIILGGLSSDVNLSDIKSDHPQYALHRLVDYCGQSVNNIKNWHSTEIFLSSNNVQRNKLCTEIMRSSETAEAWFNIAERLCEDEILIATENLKVINAPNDRKEASAIALIIREAIENPHQTIALITTNRNLVQRVKAILSKWDIKPTESAGTLLSDLSKGIYLRLLCDALECNFAPIPLLALLKHSLSLGGLSKGLFKNKVHSFERYLLRGQVIKNGLESYKYALNNMIKQSIDNTDNTSKQIELYNQNLLFINFLEDLFKPIQNLPNNVNMADFIAVYKELIIRLTNSEATESTFFTDDVGQEIDDLFSSFSDNSDLIGILPKNEIYNHIKDLCTKKSIYSRQDNNNKNVMIWETDEARFKQADIVIVASLTEGNWPPNPNTNIWLSRSMQKQLGLTPPEKHIGLSSYNFVQAICGQKVYLTYSSESNGSPNIPSRWLIRLENLLKGYSNNQEIFTKLYDTPYLAWVDMLDDFNVIPKPAKRPCPTPPLEARPKIISVTDAEKWIRDPYFIYSKHILKLKKLHQINANLDSAERGTIIHKLIENFTIATKSGFMGKPHDIMHKLVDDIIKTLQDKPILAVFLGNKLRSIATQFVDFEIERRKTLKPLMYEQKGTLSFATSQGNFTLSAKCDRIDLDKNGNTILVDYKTSSSSAHSYEQIKAGFAPQLPLQAMMIKQGGFGTHYQVVGAEYIIISNSIDIKAMKPKKNDTDEPLFSELIDNIFNQFKDWVEKYNNINTAYTSRRLPQFLKYEGDYDLLARVKEWSMNDSDDDEAELIS